MGIKVESGAELLGRMDTQTKLLLASNLVILAIIYLMQYSPSVIIWIAWIEFAIAVFGLGIGAIIKEFRFMTLFMTLFYIVVLGITYLYIVVSIEISPDEMSAVTNIAVALILINVVSMFMESRTNGNRNNGAKETKRKK